VTVRVTDRSWGRSAALLALLLAVGVASSEATPRSAARATGDSRQTVTGRAVAVTFDDLPLGGPQFGIERMAVMTDALVESIVAAGVPAVGFVNESKLDVEGEREPRLGLLRTWAGAGLELGNHTYSHPSPHRVPLQQYFDDIVRGEPLTRAVMAQQGGELRYFRHPFLFRGRTLADKEAIDSFLAGRGYTIAPVTMDNADYIYSAVYTEAKTRGDLERMKRIADAYLEFSERIYDFYEGAADTLFDRPMAHVYLLHANELNTATFDRFAAMTRERGYRFVSLEEALQDPAYASPDRYAGPAGTSWLFRWDATQAQDSGTRKIDWRAEPTVQAWVQEAFDNR